MGGDRQAPSWPVSQQTLNFFCCCLGCTHSCVILGECSRRNSLAINRTDNSIKNHWNSTLKFRINENHEIVSVGAKRGRKRKVVDDFESSSPVIAKKPRKEKTPKVKPPSKKRKAKDEDEENRKEEDEEEGEGEDEDEEDEENFQLDDEDDDVDEESDDERGPNPESGNNQGPEGNNGPKDKDDDSDHHKQNDSFEAAAQLASLKKGKGWNTKEADLLDSPMKRASENVFDVLNMSPQVEHLPFFSPSGAWFLFPFVVEVETYSRFP